MVPSGHRRICICDDRRALIYLKGMVQTKNIIYFYFNDEEAKLLRAELMQNYALTRYNMVVATMCESLGKVSAVALVEEQSLSGTFRSDASSW